MPAVSVTTAATQIVAANPNRVWLKIYNNEGQNIAWGDDNTVTFAGGMLLGDGKSLVWERTTENEDWFYTGAIFGIVGTGTADIRYHERSRPR